MYKSECMINGMMLHSFEDNTGIKRNSKNMLAHVLLSLLVFNHDFIQLRFGFSELFYFCFSYYE